MAQLESALGSGIIFDTEGDRKDLHPHPAIEGLLRVLNFKPARKNAARS